MLPCSLEITILRKQNRKGSDVSRNKITRKQKPRRLALFQKLELGTFEEGLFSLDSVGNHFPITLGATTFSILLYFNPQNPEHSGARVHWTVNDVVANRKHVHNFTLLFTQNAEHNGPTLTVTKR